MNMSEIESGAELRIAAHRTGDFRITLRDSAGSPVPRAQVTFRLVRHDFRLGANGFLIRGGARRPALPFDEWLAPAYGHDLTLSVDADRTEALSVDRAALWDRVTKAPFLTVNEKRAAIGYGALAGGDTIA